MGSTPHYKKKKSQSGGYTRTSSSDSRRNSEAPIEESTQQKENHHHVENSDIMTNMQVPGTPVGAHVHMKPQDHSHIPKEADLKSKMEEEDRKLAEQLAFGQPQVIELIKRPTKSTESNLPKDSKLEQQYLEKALMED